MDRETTIILIVGVAVVALLAIAMIWFANNSTRRVAERRFSGRSDGPSQQLGCAIPQLGNCPPGPTPVCVPAKLNQQCDEYVAVRVPAGEGGCGCGGSNSFAADLQMMADLMAEQKKAEAVDRFYQAQEKLIASRRST